VGQLRGHERSFGHQAGAETVHIITEEAARLGIKFLTLYTFSTENWNRPSDEVAALMSLLFDSIEEETFMKNNISFRIIGDINKLPENVRERLNACVEHTSKNTGMCLILALSYSARWEITEATRQIATLVQNGEMNPEEITSESIRTHLTTNFMPDPDLLIRTGGEVRLSNICFGNVLIRSSISVKLSGPTLRKKNCARLSVTTRNANADSEKPANKSVNSKLNYNINALSYFLHIRNVYQPVLLCIAGRSTRC